MLRKVYLNIRSFIDGSYDGIPARVRLNYHSTASSNLPYRSQNYLLSDGEHAFYNALRLALGRKYGLSLKTRLADIINCSESDWKSGYGNKIAQKHLDFVIYDRATTEIILAIELDDRSHNKQSRIERDKFIDDALAAAGVRVLHIKAAEYYDAAEIADCISSTLRLK